MKLVKRSILLSFQILMFLLFILSCERKRLEEKKEVKNISKDSIMEETDIVLDLKLSNKLALLPLKCLNTEYPNKLNQTLKDSSELLSPSELHPAFYGCFDWHSSVHGHWSLVTLLRQFPQLDSAQRVREILSRNLTKENIEVEMDYFKKAHNKSFERTYGWAWLLKLAEELHQWDDSLARSLSNNLYPLTNMIAQQYIDFLPQLIYPIRVGTHTNTAFGLTFAYDYAKTVGNIPLVDMIEKRAKDYYINDKDAPLNWEPSGYDFLSPVLEEAAIMRRILNKDEFRIWFRNFLPAFKNEQYYLQPGKVSNRADGHLVHLDGLNFSRAWCLYGIIGEFKEYAHLRKMAIDHINHSIGEIADNNYEGEHWLASFAIYALNAKTKSE